MKHICLIGIFINLAFSAMADNKTDGEQAWSEFKQCMRKYKKSGNPWHRTDAQDYLQYAASLNVVDAQYAYYELAYKGEYNGRSYPDFKLNMDSVQPFLERAANSGHIESMFALAELYRRKDFKRCYELLLMLSECSKVKDYPVWYMLGELNAGGLGCDKNIPAAIGYYQLAAKNGDVYAYKELGRIYYHQSKYGDAVDCLNRYLKNIRKEPSFAPIIYLVSSYIMEENYDVAIKTIVKYGDILDIKPDFALTGTELKYWDENRRAELDNLMYVFENFYQYNSKDGALMYKLYSKDNNQKDKDLLYLRAKRYEYAGDSITAYSWFEKASVQGSLEATFKKGYYLVYGCGGINPDLNRGISILEELADFQTVKFILGKIYFDGMGLEPDYEKACEYFTDISKNASGDIRWSWSEFGKSKQFYLKRVAMMYLSRYYRFVKRDIEQADYWMEEASKYGDEDAVRLQQLLSE